MIDGMPIWFVILMLIPVIALVIQDIKGSK